MSNINPQSIDGTYPIAGQDNNSQGFRSNFTNTINNFTFAAAELNDLQTKAVLKASLGSVGQTGTPTNDMEYAYLTHAQLIGAVETKNSIGNVSFASPNFTVDWEQGHYQTVDLAGNTAILTFSATWPATNLYTRLRLQCNTYADACALTLPAQVSTNISSVQGVSGQVITLPAGAVYVFEFSTSDAGATIAIEDVLRNYIVTNTAVTGSFTTVNASGNVLATGLRVFGNTSIGLTGASGGQFHSVVGNITQTSSGGAVYINTTGNIMAAIGRFGSINSTGNILGTGGILSSLTVNGLINSSGNVVAAGYGGGAVTVTGAITTSGTGGIGYAAGAGSTIVQGSGSEKNTTVTLNTATGTITLNGGICLANAVTANAFTLTNSTIAASDLILIQHQSVGSLGAYVFAATPSAGSATISVRNHSQLNLSEAIVLRFAVIKSVNA